MSPISMTVEVCKLSDGETVDYFDNIKVTREEFLGIKDLINYYNNYDFVGKKHKIICSDYTNVGDLLDFPCCFIKENDEDRKLEKPPLKDLYDRNLIHNVSFKETNHGAFFFVFDKNVTEKIPNFNEKKYLHAVEEIFLYMLIEGVFDMKLKSEIEREPSIEEESVEENDDRDYIREICEDIAGEKTLPDDIDEEESSSDSEEDDE